MVKGQTEKYIKREIAESEGAAGAGQRGEWRDEEEYMSLEIGIVLEVNNRKTGSQSHTNQHN